MRIFKFGGASVKDADGVKNVLSVLKTVGHDDVLIVISAMGKMTNALEEVIKNYFNKSSEFNASLQEVKKYHNQILMDLFEDEDNDVFFAVNSHLADLEYFLRSNKSPNYSFVYDQVISYGEIISTITEQNLSMLDYNQNSNYKIVKAYNLLGQEIPVDTNNEIIIVK